MHSPGARIFSDVASVTASGLELHIELRRASQDLTTRLALPFACPVPLDFPTNPAGVNLTVGSGPYFVARFVPDSTVVLERNRYYEGTRPHHVKSITVTMGGDIDTDIKKVEENQADVLHFEIPPRLRSGLARRYGVNRSQLFRAEGTDLAALVLNTSRPLFRNNRALRQAINFAVDRREVVRETPSGFLSRTPTDQMLPHWMPGWKDYDLYPLAAPNLARARQLARGNLRGGRAVLWTISRLSYPAQARVIVSNLRAIGLDVKVRLLSQDVIKAKAGIPGANYDMILAGGWCCPTSRFPLDYPDPGDVIVRLLGGENARRPAGNTNWAYFDDPIYNERISAADRLTGLARYDAFSKLDADIMRNEAPWVPLHESSSWLLVSKRVGCLSTRPLGYRNLYNDICLR